MDEYFISNIDGFGGTESSADYLGGTAATLLARQLSSDIEDGKIKSIGSPAQLYDLGTILPSKEFIY